MIDVLLVDDEALTLELHRSYVARLDGFRVIVCQMTNARALRDPDGLTEHGVITMRFLLDPTS